MDKESRKQKRQLVRLERRQRRQFKRLEKRGPICSFFKGVLKLFKIRPEFINLTGEELPDKAIYIGNHNAASGPISYECYFQKVLTPWGAHEMCGNYKVRWNYLYHVFYRQKLKYSKLKSFMIATLFAIVSKWIYIGVGLIPTYQDARLLKSIRYSIEVLKKGHAILIYPENSNDGYKEILDEYNHGFITLSKLFYKLHGEDLPVYNVYYTKQYAKMVVNGPSYLNKMLKEGMTEQDIARLMTTKTNELYTENVLK